MKKKILKKAIKYLEDEIDIINKDIDQYIKEENYSDALYCQSWIAGVKYSLGVIDEFKN